MVSELDMLKKEDFACRRLTVRTTAIVPLELARRFQTVMDVVYWTRNRGGVPARITKLA